MKKYLTAGKALDILNDALKHGVSKIAFYFNEYDEYYPVVGVGIDEIGDDMDAVVITRDESEEGLKFSEASVSTREVIRSLEGAIRRSSLGRNAVVYVDTTGPDNGVWRLLSMFSDGNNFVSTEDYAE